MAKKKPTYEYPVSLSMKYVRGGMKTTCSGEVHPAASKRDAHLMLMCLWHIEALYLDPDMLPLEKGTQLKLLHDSWEKMRDAGLAHEALRATA